jgi:hypothetical protein
MSCNWMLFFLSVVIIAILSGSREASARRCGRNHEAICQVLPKAERKTSSVKRVYRSLESVAPWSTGCYGFDHGAVYSPKRCNYPYPCEYCGTCGASRPLKGTISP